MSAELGWAGMEVCHTSSPLLYPPNILPPPLLLPVPQGEEATVEGYPPESFDAVLLDAPCSALGLRPRLVHRQSMAELRGTAAYQRKLLDTAVQLVKPGGTLVFSTCSINPGAAGRGGCIPLLEVWAGGLPAACIQQAVH